MSAPSPHPYSLTLLTNIPTPYRVAFLNVLAEELGANGASLRVLYCAAREPTRMWRVDLGSQRYQWKIMPGLHPNFGSLVPHLNPSVAWELVRHRPTWLLVAGAWNTPTMMVAQAVARLALPGHRLFWSEGHSDAVNHKDGPIAWGRRQVLRGYHGFAVPNAASAEHVEREAPGRPWLLLPNTVDEEFYSAQVVSEERRQGLRRRLEVPSDGILFASVAELTPRKGIDRVVRAIVQLPVETRRKVVLAIGGEGSLQAELTRLSPEVAPGRLVLLGNLDAVAVRELHQASDWFLLGSLQDPNPLAPIEAAFAGRPLLLSRKVGNWRELVHPGESGFAFDPEDGRSIAAAISEAVGVPADRRAVMGANVQRLAFERFSRRSVARTFVQALRQAFPA